MSWKDEIRHVVVLMLDAVSAAGAHFGFDRLGLRVPALLISPWVRKGRVDHRIYDHTSLLATVKALFDLPGFLTRRDAQASAVDDANFLDLPRPADDMPSSLAALLPRGPAVGARSEHGLSDLQRSLLALTRVIGSKGRAGGARPDGPSDGRDVEPQGP